jgi:hypothetical protein
MPGRVTSDTTRHAALLHEKSHIPALLFLEQNEASSNIKILSTTSIRAVAVPSSNVDYKELVRVMMDLLVNHPSESSRVSSKLEEIREKIGKCQVSK